MAEYIRKITHNNQILHDSNILSKYCLDQLIEGVFSYLLTYYDKESNDRIKELTINIQKKPYISVEDMKIVSELVHTFNEELLFWRRHMLKVKFNWRLNINEE